MTEQDERDFVNHKKEFDRICDQYKLRSEEKAGAIADFLTSPKDDGSFSAEEFAKEFGIDPVDAVIFLAWINVGIRCAYPLFAVRMVLTRASLCLEMASKAGLGGVSAELWH